MSNDDELIDDLLDRWELSWRNGQYLSVNELCRDFPELQESVRERIAALLKFERFEHAHTSSVDALRLPGRIGKYRVLSELARGGMGIVYRCRQDAPARDVAVKVIRADEITTDMLARFEREVHVLSALTHPGIVKIYDAGITDTPSGSFPFFVMELIEGDRLMEYADSKQLSITERLELVARVAEIVGHAHDQGIVHRDLKPSNVLVQPDGRPRVLDFGIARIIDSERDPSKTTHTTAHALGTLPYMSPEQASLEHAQVRAESDVYALGVLTYELLTGTLPIDPHGTNLLEAIQLICESPPMRISAHHPSLRGDMERVLGKSLEKLPPDRYQSAGEFGDDVRRYLCGQPVLARPVGAIGTAIRWGRRHPLTATLAALTICLLVLGTSISTTLAFVFQAERQRAVAALGFAERESQRASVAEAATQVQLRILARNTYNLQLEQSHALLQRNPRSALLRLNDPKLCLPEFREFTWRHLVYACEHVQQSHVFANYQLRQLAFSLDNQLVAFVDEKSQLHFIELGDNSVRSSAIQADNPSEPRCISLSPESKHLAIGHEDGRISIFEVSTGNLRQTIDQCEASVANLRYRINGELVALDKSATIHVFGAEDYEPTDKLSMVDEPETILASTISPSGLTAAILTRPRQLYITSIHEKKRYRPNFKGSMNALALLNDEQLFIAAQDRLWHMDTRSEKLVPFHHEAGRIQDIVAGGTVVAVLSANSMSLYLHSQPPFRISREPDEQLASISPNGRWLVTTRENAIYVREVSPEATQSHYVGDLAFALAEYTATQFAVLSRNGTILLIDKSTGTVDRIFPSGVQRAMHIAVSDDRQRMAVAGTLSPVRVLDTASGECEFELPERPERRTICRFITPDQLMVLSPNRISTWDLTSKSQVSSLELSGISAVAFTQDLQHFLVGTDDGEIQLRDRTTNDIAKSYGKVDAPPLRIISSAGDRQIAVAMDNRCVAIINPDGKHEVVTCGPHLLPISGLSFSRDNHTLASSSFDGSVRLWDVTNGSQRLAFEKRADACSDVLFLQDDVTLVAAHPVGQVSIWKAVRPPPTNDSLEGK